MGYSGKYKIWKGESVTVVVGKNLRWARLQRGLTLQEISKQSNISQSYLCEIEKGRKTNIGEDLLACLVGVLDVTVRFARGEIDRYHQDPQRCGGLGSDARETILQNEQWTSFQAQDRVRRVAMLAIRHSKELTPLVMAYVLGVEHITLEQMLDGRLGFKREQVKALASITALPVSFFKKGVCPKNADPYLPVIRLAEELGVGPMKLFELVGFQDWLPALRELQRAGRRPDEFTDSQPQ